MERLSQLGGMSGSGWGMAGMDCLGRFGRGREWVDGDRRVSGLDECRVGFGGIGSFSASGSATSGSSVSPSSSVSLVCSSSASVTSTIEAEPTPSVDTDIISLPFTGSDSLDPCFRSFVMISKKDKIKLKKNSTHRHTLTVTTGSQVERVRDRDRQGAKGTVRVSSSWSSLVEHLHADHR